MAGDRNDVTGSVLHVLDERFDGFVVVVGNCRMCIRWLLVGGPENRRNAPPSMSLSASSWMVKK